MGLISIFIPILAHARNTSQDCNKRVKYLNVLNCRRYIFVACFVLQLRTKRLSFLLK